MRSQKYNDRAKKKLDYFTLAWFGLVLLAVYSTIFCCFDAYLDLQSMQIKCVSFKWRDISQSEQRKTRVANSNSNLIM